MENQDVILEEEKEATVEELPFYLWGAWSQNITTPLKMDFSKPEKIVKLSLGESFALMIDIEGIIWSWGFNKSGCLGHGPDLKSSKTPKAIVIPDAQSAKFISVSVGRNHVLALTSDGRVFAWGENKKQQIGVGKDKGEIIWKPEEVKHLEKITMRIYANEDSSYVITDDKKVFAWGNNNEGQLGLSSLIDIELPKMIQNLPDIGELVIREKQVIAMQYIEDLDEGLSQDSIELEGPQLEKGISRGNSNVREQQGVLQLEERKNQALNRANTQSKSLRSARSGRSGMSSRHGGRNPMDKLSLFLKQVLPDIFGFHEEFKKIDEEIEKSHKTLITEQALLPVKAMVDKLTQIKESCFDLFQTGLNFDSIVEEKDSQEIKNFVAILRGNLLDSISLRCLQTYTMWMQNYKDSLEIHSFLNLSDHFEKNTKIILPEKKIKSATLHHCLRVREKIISTAREQKFLTYGMTSGSCLVASYVVNSVLEQLQLWTGVNNLAADISKQERRDLELKNYNKMLEKMWKVYDDVAEASLEKIVKTVKYDKKKYESPTDYIQEVLEKSEKARSHGMESLEEIKEKFPEAFNKQAQQVYRILIENLQLRDLLNESQRKLILR